MNLLPTPNATGCIGKPARYLIWYSGAHLLPSCLCVSCVCDSARRVLPLEREVWYGIVASTSRLPAFDGGVVSVSLLLVSLPILPILHIVPEDF